MIGNVRVVAHGRAATEALAEVVAAAQAANPLAPVTVVVPSNFAGLGARRLLGGGLGSGAGGGRGIANVQFVTPLRLADLLAADLLGDRRPITNPVLGAAVRRALAADPGPFGPVADHHATEAALAALYGELSHGSEATLDAVAASGDTGRLAVRFFRAIAAHLTAFHGEEDVARAAAARPDLARVLQPLGHLVWHLPEPATASLIRLLGAALAAAESSVVVAVTGDAAADAPVLAACARAGVEVPAGAVAAISPVTASHIISVTDADEEVRAVLRRVAALAEAGVPLDRIGIFHPLPDPYLHTLQQQLAAAGIPANGPSRQRLLDSVAGRTLLAALALPRERWRRDRVLALVSSAPVRDGGAPTHPGSWEEVSRAAGVVQGLEDWRHKLAGFQAALDRQLADLEAIGAGGGANILGDPNAPGGEAPGPGRARRLHRQQAEAAALWAFVDRLHAKVRAVDAARGWAGKAGAAQALLHHLLGRDTDRQSWPEAEQEAANRVEDALSRLAGLDELEPDPPAEVFGRALHAELDVSRGRVGRFGEGVVYGPLSGAVGHDLDAVFVLGLAEGQWPAPRRDDALLPDSARAAAVDGELTLRAARLPDQHRALLAALAAAPAEGRHLFYPRGDLRGGRHRIPSRWLLDSASARAGRPVYSTDFADLRAPVVEVVPSFAAGVKAAPTHASRLDRDLAVLGAHVDLGHDPAAHPVAAELGRAFECAAARRSEALTEWDGNLAGLPVPSPASGDVLSPSRLEQWAACGFRYFLASVLGLRDRDDPERIVDIGAQDRGSAVHEILERFFSEVIDAGAPGPDEAWTPAQRDRLQAIADEVFTALVQRGRTGRAVHWRVERQRLAVLLDDFLTQDDAFRARARARPVRVEMPFGLDGAPPVTIPLAGGRVVQFRGRADRVDLTTDGHHLVSDYKTGKGTAYERIGTGDPVQAGRTLQLGLYAAAAFQLLGADEAEAHYWMVDEQASFARHGYPWDESRHGRFVQVLSTIVQGIEAGVFGVDPGEWDGWRGTHKTCTYCAFDDVCLRDRGEQAELKQGAPALRVRDGLVWVDPEDG